MKNLSRTSKKMAIAVSIIAVATVLALAQGKPDKWGRVTIVKTPHKPDRILLFGPSLNDKEQKAFNKTLAKYDQKYYKIVTFKKGEKVSTRGTLEDMEVGGVSYSEVVKEAQGGGRSAEAWACDGSGAGNISEENSGEKMVEDMKKTLARFTR
jgi:hypothetical protein